MASPGCSAVKSKDSRRLRTMNWVVPRWTGVAASLCATTFPLAS